ncbi:hypothetical protein AGABI1DRAFT_132402 [Agaricus bisporus var. burnettii JB137-S8]|uniref:G-protein alpha subunit n=1 Tax=Agaricus bisporus var. burnettii (strain JB137-S8 / ATCC MYA-4627 / FGSC 10392) TaxID=597362 RepID=K5WWT3_AGABU|nr:uncharacterized protein AGABI1DRAFT_132402 [Agaricus bisporus var. burnettii JB137-S8]EKM75263.1 hypothetical protein AGABI1DRAFT_132402 [Agaricus bisporus var. burnettii JB137-S8]
MTRRASINSFTAPMTAAPPKDNADARNRLIDEDIKKENAQRREERKREVRANPVMLLGQAESGKSTLQKQFQIYYAFKSLERERPCWKPVVFFNIIKALRVIFNELEYRFSEYGNQSLEAPLAVQNQLSELRTKLLPLISLEDSLASQLNGGVTIGSGGQTGAFVRSGWQTLVGGTSESDVQVAEAVARTVEVSTLTAKTLASSLSDIQTLWRHPTVKLLFQDRKVRLEESAPFFLDEIDRISEPDYVPTTDDILNVRLQTLGIMEHSFPVTMGGLSYNWKLYDVGGAYLEEDSKVNRIEDSLQLFSAICSSKLLKDADLVLLLNKADLLKKKLAAGILIRQFITSYGDRANNFEAASNYFKSHFQQVHRKKDPWKRSLWLHYTTMLDVKATQKIISNVGEAIIRKHIAEIGLT